jgi:hypothetical protein
MIGWILVIVLAFLLIYTADLVANLAVWLLSMLSQYLPITFDFLDVLMPYARSAVQVLGGGLVVVAVLAIAHSIIEER